MLVSCISIWVVADVSFTLRARCRYSHVILGQVRDMFAKVDYFHLSSSDSYRDGVMC